MAADVEVSGPGLAALQRKIAALDKAAAGGLQRELEAGLIAGATPLLPKVRDAALRNLPRRGGLAAKVAGLPMRVSLRRSPRSPAVLLTVDTALAAATNAGKIRHPVYGEDAWVTQSIRPRWASDVVKNEAPKTVGPGLEAAMARVARKVELA